jgi:hypothetical protein
MEHEHGAFKVNREMRPWCAVENGVETLGLRAQLAFPMLQCRKAPAANLASLPYLLMK